MRGAWEQHVPAPPWFTEAISDTGRAATATVDGRRIAYRRWGDPGNHTAVLIHGGAAHAHWWDHIAPLLAAEREVIAFDLSGHGDSEHQSHYSVARWASEALAVSSLTSSPKPVLIGHSLGGIVALEAARAGADLGGVVIIDSPIVNATPEEKAATERLAFGPAHLYPSRTRSSRGSDRSPPNRPSTMSSRISQEPQFGRCPADGHGSSTPESLTAPPTFPISNRSTVDQHSCVASMG